MGLENTYFGGVKIQIRGFWTGHYQRNYGHYPGAKVRNKMSLWRDTSGYDGSRGGLRVNSVAPRKPLIRKKQMIWRTPESKCA